MPLLYQDTVIWRLVFFGRCVGLARSLRRRRAMNVRAGIGVIEARSDSAIVKRRAIVRPVIGVTPVVVAVTVPIVFLAFGPQVDRVGGHHRVDILELADLALAEPGEFSGNGHLAPVDEDFGIDELIAAGDKPTVFTIGPHWPGRAVEFLGQNFDAGAPGLRARLDHDTAPANVGADRPVGGLVRVERFRIIALQWRRDGGTAGNGTEGQRDHQAERFHGGRPLFCRYVY